MACSICDSVGLATSVNTGRDERFQDPITRMTHYDLADGEDYWECPECEAVFAWHDYTAFTGSGNNDEQTLTRIAEPHATTIRTLHRGTSSVADKDLPELAAAIAFAHGGLVSTLLCRDRALAWRLVPCLAAHGDAVTLLVDMVDAPADARQMRATLGSRTDSYLGPVWERVRVTGCTICRDIPGYPGLTVSLDRLPPAVAQLEQLGHSIERDVWRCLECDSVFEWNGRTVRRIPDPFAASIRNCLYANVITSAALQMVRDGGSDWTWVCERTGR